MEKENLTSVRALELLAYDCLSGVLTRRVSLSRSVKVGDVAGCHHPTKKYLYLYVDGKRYFAHRVVWLMHTGGWPSGQIDHIDGDRTNNRIENLRDVDGAINGQNKRSARVSNTSGLLGVSWMTNAGKWRAQIKVARGVVYLGLFTSKVDAYAVYLSAKRELHAGCVI